MHDPAEDQLAIVLGQRQLMAVFCMLLTVLGLVATLAYVAGRSITAAQFQAQEGEQANSSHPMVVDPPSALEARAQRLSPQAPPVATGSVPIAVMMPVSSLAAKPTPSPVVIPKAPADHPAPESGDSGEPAPGQIFWQVGLVDTSMIAAMQDRVRVTGLPVRIASGNSAQSRRVLVGPLASPTDVVNAKRTLDDNRIQAFLKTY